MKITLFVAAVSICSLSWLGMSFATPSEAPEDSYFSSFSIKQIVSAAHPDSHRLGAKVREEVALPAWEEAGIGPELARFAE